MRPLIALTLLLLSCNREPDKITPKDARDSIAGVYNGQVREWHSAKKFDSVKQATYIGRDDSMYAGTCEIIKLGTDSFAVKIEPSVVFRRFHYIPGQRSYTMELGKGGFGVTITPDSITYGSQECYTLGTDCWGTEFRGKR